MIVDLNCDLGEGGPADDALLTLITSANIACGYHAGDAEIMLRTVLRAVKHGVRIGAHPGHADRANFGRTEITRTMSQVFADTLYQVGALAGIALGVGTRIHHLKPHGALYHQASRDPQYAEPIIRVCEFFELALVGPPDSQLQHLAAGRCPFIAEGFADRGYQADGTLVPRHEPNAFIHDPQVAVEQMERLLNERGVRTICVHGDHPEALLFVQQLREALLAKGHTIQAFQ